jgi:DNA-binding IclR family transcriptional regulator
MERAGGPLEQRELYTVRAVVRAARLLETLRASDGDASLAELAAGSGIAKASVFRLLRTLEETGLVERTPDGDRYRLGLRCLELGQAYLEQTDLRREAMPVLSALRERHNETVHLAALDDDLRVVYLEKLESTHAVGIMMSRIGRTAPSFCTGLGKAMLAALPGDPVRRLEEQGILRPYTEATIAEPRALRQELARIRERGYSLDLEEHEPGVRCVGSAIYGPSGDMVAGLSIAGPAQRLPERLLRGPLAEAARAAATEIGRRLGGRRRRSDGHPGG